MPDLANLAAAVAADKRLAAIARHRLSARMVDALAMFKREPGVSYGGPPTPLERRGLVSRSPAGHAALTRLGLDVYDDLFPAGPPAPEAAP